MCRIAACKSGHQEYAFIGWIPSKISVADIQILAPRTAVYAAEHERPYAGDFPGHGPPLDFR